MAPDEIVTAVKDAGLKGRGGAGFSTGLKWSLMPKDESMNIRYLLCNADEMEPGTYKDRLLMEQLPHLLVEGMLISAFALKAYRGYIFLRGEYIEAAQHLRRAIAEATEAGLLGKNILGTGFDFELFVHTGAGRYICGEETALINSLEGRRANPRSAAVPGELRRLGQADLRQQRRNPVQRASDPRQRRRVVPEHFHQQRCWHQADGLLRPGEESGRLGAAVRHHCPRDPRRLRRRYARWPEV